VEDNAAAANPLFVPPPVPSPLTQTPPAGTRIVPENIADLYRQAAHQHAARPAFFRRGPDKAWQATSFAEVYETGLALGTALLDLGVEARSHVGLLCDNRLEWILTDCAIQLCGAADVPRGTDITDGEITHILSHADVEVLFVENPSTLEKLERCRKNLRQLREVILIDPREIPAGKHLHHWHSLVAKGRELRRTGDRRLEERMAGIQPDDLFTLIYTSGTTGMPKGVMLSHANMVSQIRNLPFPLSSEDRALSILPVWHSYERVFEMVAISWGLATYYTSLRSIAEDLRTAKPTVMASAPRLWESLYQKILGNIKSASPIRRSLFHAAYHCAKHVKRAEFFFRGHQLDLEGRRPGQSLPLAVGHLLRWLLFLLPYRLLDRLVLAKLRQIVGGEFRGTISGGGALQPHVDEFYNFIGIPVLEGYGMTETAPVLAVRTWDNLVIGTVGPFFPETEIRIVDLQDGSILYPNPKLRQRGCGVRGEIHARGPQVMKGYYKNPEATDKVLRDGWMNTGDIGMVTFNGCLKILGRSKETIVLLSGENVEPVPIEGRLVESCLIEQCMVVGQDQKFLAALIVPSLEGFREMGLEAEDATEIAQNPRTRTLLDADVRRLVCPETGFKNFERIGDWRIIPKSFTVGDELTNTFKLKRHVITDRYQTVIDSIYKDKAKG
jgi:long-chain acyl-CoA synthetase